MNYPFTLLIWGYVITIFDFRINGFNIVFDSIGWIMVAFAIAKLPNIRSFTFAKRAAVIVVFLSLPEIFPQAYYEHNNMSASVTFIFTVITGLSQLLIMFIGVNLLSGFAELLKGKSDVTERLEKFKKTYLIVQTVVSFGLLARFVIFDEWLFLLVALVIIAWLFHIYLIFLFNRVKHVFKEVGHISPEA
ncbi:hypothetical protein [Bacillus solimangrovi]|uniref:Uncharacterized protein n=1 Tax=Bacillus solimangrovi TaxID=1305675 RepID=A0A1E5LFP7_9BACI|nr:hypothetical protein [Bacillus solimangrovi]OEH92907.1 hypothetical protein BFG57_14635 [Bacillus solimangrovi]